MKILIYSDVHWSTYSSIIRKRTTKYSVRLDKLIASMNWVQQLGKELNCDLEVCCGDFMDKSNMSAEELTALKEVNWSDIDKRFLVGNHDSNVSSLEFSTVSAINKQNINIISSPIKETIGGCKLLFLPYSDNYDEVNECIKQFADEKGDNKFIFSHADIKGIRYGRIESCTGLDQDVVKGSCNMLFNGHLHEGSKVSDNIINIGSLSAHNFTNDASKHDYGVYVLDTTARSIEFIPNPYAFNFYKIYVNFQSDLDKLSSLKNQAVLSVACNNTLIEQAEAKIKSLDNVVEYKLISTFEMYNADGEEIDFKVEDHLKQFVEFVQTKIEPSPVLTEEIVLLGEN